MMYQECQIEPKGSQETEVRRTSVERRTCADIIDTDEKSLLLSITLLKVLKDYFSFDVLLKSRTGIVGSRH